MNQNQGAVIIQGVLNLIEHHKGLKADTNPDENTGDENVRVPDFERKERPAELIAFHVRI